MRSDTLAAVVESVREHLADAPAQARVSTSFATSSDDVLYVGKAKSLRARVRSYFNRGDGRAGIGQMVRADRATSR